MSTISKLYLEEGQCYEAFSFPYPGKYLGKYIGPIDNEGILQHKFEHHVYADLFIPEIEPFFKKVPCESNSSASAASTVSKSSITAPNARNEDPGPVASRGSSASAGAVISTQTVALPSTKCPNKNKSCAISRKNRKRNCRRRKNSRRSRR